MSTAEYWNKRYADGTGPGGGSKGDLYAFKLETVQKIVDKYKVKSVVDYGCGDGSQLAELKVKEYTGTDVSKVAISKAKQYAGKGRKYSSDMPAPHEMAISLDVIPHLPDGEFEEYMENLFALAEKYVLIYAGNRTAGDLKLEDHMHFRVFTEWIEQNTEAEQIEHIPNVYPAEKPGPLVSFAEFFLFKL